MKIQKDDTVLVIAGKDKGKTGEVIAAYPREERVVVQGVNKVKKHQKKLVVKNLVQLVKVAITKKR